MRRAGFETLEFGSQVVHEPRLDHLEDVLLGGVVRALGAALRWFHDRLEQHSECGRADTDLVSGKAHQFASLALLGARRDHACTALARRSPLPRFRRACANS